VSVPKVTVPKSAQKSLSQLRIPILVAVRNRAVLVRANCGRFRVGSDHAQVGPKVR